MLDDHKYSLKRTVAYNHPDPERPAEQYGVGGPERTFGVIIEVYRVEDEPAHWEYAVKNSFTDEVRRVPESEVFHGADQAYLDLRRRDGIRWLHGPPEAARGNADSPFWRRTLRQFVRTAIPKIREREQDEKRARLEGRGLALGPGDYAKVRGDLRRETEPHHNLYAKILSVSPADIEHLQIPRGRGITPGTHKVQRKYHVLLDSGDEADVYDVEIKVIYTTHGRTVVLNWRAAAFLAEAFGDDPPYDLQLEYLDGHVFSRAELDGMSADDLADLLTRLLYAKGMITWEEFAHKADSLAKSPPGYLVDQMLDLSRFDRRQNRPLTDEEIEQARAEDARLRGLFE